MKIHNIESFLSYFGRVRARTMRVVLSAGDLVRHIVATDRYTFAEDFLGQPSRYRGCGPALA